MIPFIPRVFRSLGALLLCGFLSVPSAPARADGEHPTRAEVAGVYSAIAFRGAMFTDPATTIESVQSPDARAALDAITAAMDEAGSGSDGWRYLMNGAVFAMVGFGEPQSLVMFYNPWVDIAIIGEWMDVETGRQLVDLEWMPGDILRGDPIELQPAWVRTGSDLSGALLDGMEAAISGFETTFATRTDRKSWRAVLNLSDRSEVSTVLSPLLALRVFESQLRLVTLAVSDDDEDPLMKPLRIAIVDLIATAEKQGFTPLLEAASETPQAMKAVLAQLQPGTLQGLTPIAFLADQDEVVVFFISRLTADFTLAAKYRINGSTLDLAQLDFIGYAATLAERALDLPAVTPEPAPVDVLPPASSLGLGKTIK